MSKQTLNESVEIYGQTPLQDNLKINEHHSVDTSETEKASYKFGKVS